MKLHREEFGEGPPLIILHGLFGSGHNWRSIARALAERWRVLLPDLRNHGRSPHEERMDYAAMVEDLAELIGELKEPVRLMGHSMGGKTAMLYALACPETIEKLIIADIAPKAYGPRHAGIIATLQSLDLEACPSRVAANEALSESIPDPAVRRFLTKNLDSRKGRLHWKINLEAIGRNYEKLYGWPAPEAEAADLPVLFVAGAESDFLGPEDLPAIATLFPRAELATVPDAAHWLHTQNPEAFLKIIRRFLAQPSSH